MSQVTEQSVRFQTALASIKLIQASAVLDLTEDDFDFLTSNKVWIATDRSEERFSRNAETDIVCRLLLEKKNDETGRLTVDGMHIISNDGSNKLNRSRKPRVSYKVQRTINASLNAATSTRAVSSNPNFVTRQKIEIIFG